MAEASQSDEMLKTQFVVEATGCEVLMLWGQFSTESMTKGKDNTYTWVQHYQGHMITVGEFHGFPVTIALRWFTINGVLVMFWEPISRVVDHEMIKDWLLANCAPRWDHGTRLAHTNAMNFHHVLDHIRTMNAR